MKPIFPLAVLGAVALACVAMSTSPTASPSAVVTVATVSAVSATVEASSLTAPVPEAVTEEVTTTDAETDTETDTDSDSDSETQTASDNEPATSPAAPEPSESPTDSSPPVVRWQSASRTLTPETTVELIFPGPMIQPGSEGQTLELGQDAAPMVITPTLSGRWRWRSRESGVFTPLEAPVRGQTYTLTVRDGLRDSFDHPLAATQPDFVIKTAGLRLTHHHPTWYSSDNVPRQPNLILQFNEPVDEIAARQSLRFINAAGTSVPAIVRRATFGDLPRNYYIQQAFREQALSLAAPDQSQPPAPELALPGTLVVTPASPLPVGEKWQLTATDVVTADGKSTLEEPASIEIGDIPALGIGHDHIEHSVGSPKQIVLRFNKPIASNLAADEVTRRVSIAPVPAGLKATFAHQELTLAGEFLHETSYQVTLADGLRAEDGVTMDDPYTGTFLFKVLPPAVALPALSATQMSQGRAVFNVRTVNLSTVKVRVKAAGRDALIYALRAYRQYTAPVEKPSNPEPQTEEEANEGGGGFNRIAFDAMPGQKVLEQDFSPQADVDAMDEYVVDWRQALNGRPAGALFISVEGDARPEWAGRTRQYGAQAFIQLTDIGAAWKLTADEAFLYVFSQSTGQPLEGVTLSTFDAENRLLTTVQSAADGTARLSRNGAAWLLAEKGDDLHAVDLAGDTNWSNGLGMWRFGVPYDWNPPTGPTRHVAVFTERPLYLPGHTVYYKAVSRFIDTDGVTRPGAPESAILRAFDAKDRLIHERDVRFSQNGSLDGSLVLPEGALGTCRIDLIFPAPIDPAAAATPDTEDNDGAAQFSTYFSVEEYTPNAFQIEFADDSFTLEKEKASIALQANYLLGKPLAQAKLAWTASVTRSNFASPAFPQFQFLDSRRSYYYDEEGYHNIPENDSETTLVTAQAATALTDDGRAALEFTVPATAFAQQPRTVEVIAEITGLNQQTITESWSKTLHSSSYYLGLRELDTHPAAGKTTPITVAAARQDGEPWPHAVETKITVEKIDFIPVRLQTVGGGTNVRTEIQRGIVAEGMLTVAPKGQDNPAFPWTPKAPGFYYITARATDPDGRLVESTTSTQVYGPGWTSWQENDGVKIELTADKSEYIDGDTARILVKSPVAGRALVTVERRGVMDHFFTEITGNAQIIEVPVLRRFAPNVFVSVFIIRGAAQSPHQHPSPDYRLGVVQLTVKDDSTRLAVSVASNQPDYRPGDQGTASATVTDANGQPVAGAEVTFWAADDGVLTLQNYVAPDLGAEFHRLQPLAVLAGTSLMNQLPEDPRELAFSNKGYLIGGGGYEAGGESARKNFQPVAFFHGSLLTDAAGRVTASFTVPDSLTRFRIIAVATAGDNQFGTAEGGFNINKPLMLEPAMPRFATVGDEITVNGVVLNTTDQAMEVEVTLTLDALASSTEKLVKKVSLSPKGSAAAPFSIKFDRAGAAAWQWRAVSLTPGLPLADTVVSTLNIGHAQPTLRELHYAAITAGDESKNLLATANPEIMSGQGELTFTVSNSSMAEASGALAYLLHYPYGCAEQTTSSLIPWLVLQQLKEAVPSVEKSPADIQKSVQAGVNRLLGMQTSSGGLSYWPGGRQPELWASCYAGMGLVLARDGGAVVPPARLLQLADYLSTTLRETAAASSPDDLYTRAFACYTLALIGRAEPAYHDVLSQKVALLPHPARALLAMAILHTGGTRDRVLALLNAPLNPNLDEWNTALFDSRLTALNLMVWTRLDPVAPTTVSLSARLLNERTSAGHWGSTYTNAWALLALAAETKSQNPAATATATTVNIHFDGHTTPVSLPARPATRSITLPLTGSPDQRALTVTGMTSSRLRTAITLETRPPLTPVEPRTQGLSISRKYAEIMPDGTSHPADDLEIGDLVAVTLDLNIPERSQYVAVDDPLPAVLEAVNPKFKSQAQSAAGAPLTDHQRINWWYSSHHELRRDRALFFADEIWSPGRYQLNYLARVVASGAATAPSAKIEIMYQPERYGLSGTQRLGARATGAPAAVKKQ